MASATAPGPRVSFQTAPSPQAIPWSPEDETRITDLLRESLQHSLDSWNVTLIFSGVLSHTWVVECERVEDGRRLRMLIDTRRPEDGAALRVALASLGGVGEEGPCPPGRDM